MTLSLQSSCSKTQWQGTLANLAHPRPVSMLALMPVCEVVVKAAKNVSLLTLFLSTPSDKRIHIPYIFVVFEALITITNMWYRSIHRPAASNHSRASISVVA